MQQNRRSKNNFPSKSLADSIKSTTFVPTRTRQASSQCLNRRVVLFLYGTLFKDLHIARPAQATIVAMMPSRVLRVTGEQMKQYFSQNIETMEFRAVIAEHILNQFHSRYIDLHRATPRERYDLLMQRCPGIVGHLDLQDIASFLNVHPNTISKIRRDITFEGRKQ